MSSSDRTLVVVDAVDDDVVITVADAYGTVVGRGRVEVRLELPAGLYLASVARLGRTAERSFVVPDDQRVTVDPPPFHTAVPLVGTLNCPTNIDAISAELQAIRPVAGHQTSGALLIVVIGDDRSPPDLDGLDLRALSGDLLDDLSRAESRLDGTLTTALVELPSGAYELRHRPVGSAERRARSIAVPVARGRTTWVFLRANPRPFVQHAGIVIGQTDGSGFDPHDEILAVAEQSLLGLLDDEPYFPAAARSRLEALDDPTPMSLVAAAHTALRRDDEQTARRIIARALAVAGDLADVTALAMSTGQLALGEIRFEVPPTTRAGFDAVMAAAADNDQLLPPGGVVERLASCLYEDSPWTCWDPDAVGVEVDWIANGIRDLRVGRRVAEGSDPALTESDIVELAQAMRLPRRLVEAAHQQLRAPLEAKPPYPGLTAYTVSDADIFFGREREIDRVVDQLVSHGAAVLVAASGAGKSSLIDAGVVPAVIAEGWTVHHALLDGARADIDITSLEVEGDSTLLVIDHFEIALRTPDRESTQLWEAIETFRARSGARLLLAVRADAYGDLIASNWWEALEPFVLALPPMRAEAIARSIELPAEMCDVVFERDLVDRLVADCSGEPGALPLLQQTLRRIWSAASHQYIPLSTYESLRFPPDEMEDHPDHRSGIDAAIALHAEEVWDNEERRDPSLAAAERRLLLRLIHFDDDGSLRARRAHLADFDAERDRELRSAAAALAEPGIRLVTLGKHGTVDLSYELLLSAWPRLQTWATREASDELLRRDLQREATGWAYEGGRMFKARRGQQHREATAWRERLHGRASPQIQRYLAAGTKLARLEAAGVVVVAVTVAALAAFGVVALASAYQDATKKNDARVELVEVAGLTGEFALEATEVTNARYRACVELGSCTMPRQPGRTYTFDDDDLPVVYVDGFQAAAFCAWLGLQLPTRDEWFDAVTDRERRPYPWGSDAPTAQHVNMVFDVGDTEIDPTDARVEEFANMRSVTAQDILVAFPEFDVPDLRTTAEFFAEDWPDMDVEERMLELQDLIAVANEEDQAVRTDRELVGELVPVGDPAFASGATPSGIRHLIGNVEEWTATPDDCGPSARRCVRRWSGLTAINTVSTVGGSFTDPGGELGPATLEPTYHQALAGEPDRGFRCARST